MKTNFILFGMAFILFACGSNNQNNKTEKKDSAIVAAKSNEELAKTLKINVDSTVKAIDIERKRIEDNLKSYQKKSLSTANLRARSNKSGRKLTIIQKTTRLSELRPFPMKKFPTGQRSFIFRMGN